MCKEFRHCFLPVHQTHTFDCDPLADPFGTLAYKRR